MTIPRTPYKPRSVLMIIDHDYKFYKFKPV